MFKTITLPPILNIIFITLALLIVEGCNGNSSDKNSHQSQKKTIGHSSSFFKQSERLSNIVDYTDTTSNRIKIDEIYPNLLKLKSNYFAYGFWTLEERTNYAWSDFRQIVSRLQRDRPNTSLYIYVGDPTYGNGKNFCWDKTPSGNQCNQEASYTNYPLWAEKIATLSKGFPIVKGMLIDDFMFSLATDGFPDKLFTPAYLDNIKSTGKNINTNFRLEVVWYINRMSAYHAKIVSGHIDAVHGFYIHSDGDRADPNPDRIVSEIDIFSRIFSNTKSPVISIYRRPDKPATANKKIITRGNVDISALQKDLSIAYWDSVNSSNPNDFGWNQVSIFFNDQVIYQQDIAEGVGDNDIQVFKIPYSTIQALQDSGIKNAELRMEVLTLKSYSRWSYILNLFILSPDNTPVTWKYTDEEKSYKVATSNDITSPIDRYLGLYGGHLNTFEVTKEYTNTVLSHAQKALNSNKIEGVVSWEVMMHPPESETFSLYQKFFKNNKN